MNATRLPFSPPICSSSLPVAMLPYDAGLSDDAFYGSIWVASWKVLTRCEGEVLRGGRIAGA